MNIKNDKKILVTGGCGYIGSILVEKLLQNNYDVVVFDNQWFGNFLKKNKKLSFIKDDIRNFEKHDLKNFDCLIHLANIANDPGVDLNPILSWEVNVLSSHQIMEKIINETSIKQVIFASSGSVYGIKEEDQVTEDLKLVPISTYNKTKMVAEKVLLNYRDKLKIHCIRPATVCGYSPRMRLDVTVNMLTFQALQKKEMTIHGGKQIRPNIHIQDLTNVFIHFLKNNKIESGVYNAGFENLSILNIAEKIKKKLNSKINILPINDPRSYKLNSDKLLKTGFENKYNVDNAIDEIINKYNLKEFFESDNCYTVQWMKKLNL